MSAPPSPSVTRRASLSPFTPIIRTVARARADGIERLVGLPVYPLCGPSTTVAALATLAREVAACGWEVELCEIGGWHPHRAYTALRAEGIRVAAERHGLDLETNAVLLFSAHGTPLKYLREGSRYDVYVRPVSSAEPLYRISTSGGWSPKWRDDGREIFFQAEDRPAIMAVTVNTTPSFQASPPVQLFETVEIIRGYDVAPGGQRFLLNLSVAADRAASALTLVLHWPGLLQAR